MVSTICDSTKITPPLFLSLKKKKSLPEKQPPKRKAGGPSTAPKPRQSKLAKEHNVSAQEEGEIKEAFGLFAEPMDGEKNGVLPIHDVKSALM
jgi:hydroxyacylglutathione hydrolase